jgi:choline dehydrogenase-like flavoprotein
VQRPGLFEPPKFDYLLFSGWPIKRDDLEPYYARVHELCEIGPFDYSAGCWASDGAQPFRFAPDTLTSSVFSFGPTQAFTADFPLRFAKDHDIDVYLFATAVELLPAEAGQILQRARVQTLDGNQIFFKAKYFVIAAGGFEGPRLLLNSRSRHEHGIGNQNDVVGRYYMDHSLVSHGHFYPRDMQALRQLAFYDMRMVTGSSVLGKFSLAPEVLRRERLRNFSSMLFPKPGIEGEQAFYSLRTLTSELRSRRIPDSFWKHVTNVARGSK